MTYRGTIPVMVAPHVGSGPRCALVGDRIWMQEELPAADWKNPTEVMEWLVVMGVVLPDGCEVELTVAGDRVRQRMTCTGFVVRFPEEPPRRMDIPKKRRR